MTDPQRPPLPRQMRYPQPTPPPGDQMPVPPDGRHPLYPNTPRHLNPVTAEGKAIPLQPRHRHAPPPEHIPTAMIPKIDSQRVQYPAWMDKLETAGDRLEDRLAKSKIALIVLCLFALIGVILLAIYVGTHI